MKDYEKKGQMGGNVLTIVSLIISVGISVMVLIFVGSLGGQTYELVEPDIDSLSIAAGTTNDLTVLQLVLHILVYKVHHWLIKQAY